MGALAACLAYQEGVCKGKTQNNKKKQSTVEAMHDTEKQTNSRDVHVTGHSGCSLRILIINVGVLIVAVAVVTAEIP